MNRIQLKAKPLLSLSGTWGLAAVVVALVLSLTGTAARAQAGTSATSIIFFSGVGAMPGQTMRVNVFQSEKAAQNQSGNAHVKVFDGNGGLLYESPEAAIPACGFQSFEINRDSIAKAGVPRTGRVQVRVEVVIKAAPARERAEGIKARIDKLPLVIMELVDSNSGETTAMLLPAVQKVREVAPLRN